MSNKFLIYACGVDFTPKNMTEVNEFAKENHKLRIASVELNRHLANVKAGDNIITGKGNSLYVVKAITSSLDNLSKDDQEYIDTLAREYGLKKVNITSVAQVIPFETWCKEAKPFFNNKTKTMKNSIKSLSDRIKEMFMPIEAEDVRIATDGNICVETNAGYVAIDKDNNLTSYPEELTIDLPVYVISKSKEQLAVGDVIALDRSYAKVVGYDKKTGKISAIGYTGAGKTIHTIKDFLFNQTMVRVVVSLAGQVGTGINPMMLMLMSKDKSSLLPLMMMSQNQGAVGMNPMMLMLMAGDGNDISTKDLMLMGMMGGQNPFGNLFNSAPETAAAEKA